MSADVWGPEHDEPIGYVIDDELERVEGIVKRAALRASHPTREDFDDVAQEARIAAWLKLRDEPYAPDAWIGQVTGQRARNVAAGRSHFGAAPVSRGSGHRAPERAQSSSVSMSAVEDAVAAGFQTPEPLTLPAFDEEAVDRLDVADAMAELSPEDRELVRCRFWYGLTDAETGARLGIERRAVATRWRRIMPRLRAALEVTA